MEGYETRVARDYLHWYDQMVDLTVEKMPGICRIVPYESLSADPESVLREVAEWCGIQTGTMPKPKDVKDTRAPQLPLEAAIALLGTGFAHVSGSNVAGLRFIRASGGEPAGEQRDIEADDIAGIAEKARHGLAELVALYDSVETPYRAIRRPGFRYDYDDYAHLARVAEWSAHVEEEGQE